MSGLYLPYFSPQIANDQTHDDQTRPITVALANGGYLTAWTSQGQDGSGLGLYIRSFDALGTPQGAAYQLNSHSAGDQQNLTLTQLSNGHYVAVWESYGQDGSRWGVYAQRLSASGQPIGPEIQVADDSLGNQYRPHVTATDTGFVIGWWDPNDQYTYGQFGDLLDRWHADSIHVQAFTNTGQEIGAELRLGGMVDMPYLNASPYTSIGIDQQFGAMVPTADGGFAVIYEATPEVVVDTGDPETSYSHTGSRTTWVQSYAMDGTADGTASQLVAGLLAPSHQLVPLSDGTVALLTMDTSWSTEYGLRLRFLDPETGTLSDTAYLISRNDTTLGPTGTEYLTTSTYAPMWDIAEMADGSLLLVYQTTDYAPVYDSDGRVTDYHEVYNLMGVQLDVTGTELNPAFLIATLDGDPAYNLDITALAGGGGVVSWSRFGAENPYDRDIQQVSLLGLSSGTTGNDTLTGTGGTDWIDALSGDDRVSGLGGNDVLEGNLGEDFLNGGGGDDRLDGGDHADTLMGGAGNDQMFGGAGNDRLMTGAGDDLFDGGEGTDTLLLRSGHEIDLRNDGSTDFGDGADRFVSIENVLGTNGADRITGSDRANVINGRSGHDWLNGADGNDSILAGNGNDTLVGGGGADNLMGGNGADVFVFSAAGHLGRGTGADRITDFQTGQDVIALAAFSLDWRGAAAFTGTAAELRVNVIGSHSQLQLDLDGDGRLDGQILVLNETNLSAADFLF